MKPKQSLSCRYHTELMCGIDKANIAKRCYWMCKEIYSSFSQAGETFERLDTKNKFHGSETEGVQFSQFQNNCGDLKRPLQELQVPVPELSAAGASVPLSSWPRTQKLLCWKILCPGRRRWSRRAATARNQKEIFGNIVGKHFEKGQVDSEQTGRERALVAAGNGWGTGVSLVTLENIGKEILLRDQGNAGALHISCGVWTIVL